MKKVDIVRLRLKGVSNEEIKELMELEALAEDGEKDPDEKDPDGNDPDGNDPDEDPDDKKKEDDKDEDPNDNDDKKKDPSSGIDEAKKEIEELKKKLAAAQKANAQKDISGDAAPKDTDQDIFNKAVASFM